MKVISVLGDSTSGVSYIRRGCCRKEKLVEEERKVRHMKLKDAIASPSCTDVCRKVIQHMLTTPQPYNMHEAYQTPTSDHVDLPLLLSQPQFVKQYIQRLREAELMIQIVS